jgi:hypothetical protein
MVECS